MRTWSGALGLMCEKILLLSSTTSVDPVFPGTPGTLLALSSQRPPGRADLIGTAVRSGYPGRPGGFNRK